MATKRKAGEYILLDWDCCEPPWELVFGWVTEEDALAAIATEHGEEEVRRWAADCGVKIEHGYGRWNVSANWSDWDQCFERVEGPGRGRFKVTYVTFGR